MTPTPATDRQTWPASPGTWWPFLAGVALTYALFDWSANALGSDRGQHGVLVAAIIVSTTFAMSRVLLGESRHDAVGTLGLGAPRRTGIAAALVACGLLLLVVPLYAAARDTPPHMFPGWLGLLPGLLAQAGVAEETLFRGYLFGHIRRGRSFWKAAWIASAPFVLVHLVLLVRLPIPVALASIGLALLISFPLAWLYDLGGRSIWPPALLHAVVQGVVKVVVFNEAGVGFAITWMAACATLPFVVFLFRPVTAPNAERVLR
jgi:membrane protease YdiL (CAAX protease family)